MGTISLVPCVTAQQTDRTEAARREMAARDARQLVQEARNAYKAGRYTQAVEHYRSALYTMPKSDSLADRRFVEFVKLSLSDALIARAIDYRTVGRYEEAVEFLREALQLAPDNKRAEVELLHTKDPVRHNPALSPQHVGDVAEVNRLLELGYAQIDLAKFDEAIATFAAIIKIDPYNSAARQGQELARRHKMTYYRTARNAARANMLADVDKQWEESVSGGAPQDLGATTDFVAAVDAEMQADFARRAIGTLQNELYLGAPDTGIAFTVPLNGGSLGILQLLSQKKPEEETQEETPMHTDYSMVLAFVNQGYSEEVMSAARKAGAGGGTVFHTRRVESDDAAAFWGISIQEEREIVLILVKKEQKKAIMEAISEGCGAKTDAHGIIVSLPVDEVAGLKKEIN